MKRIGDNADMGTEAVISMNACMGAPRTIQNGAVVKMAEALTEAKAELIADIKAKYGDDPHPAELSRMEQDMGLVRTIGDALRAYYGEDH